MPPTRPYLLGDEVFLLLTLVGDPEKLPVAGRVEWITPESAQGNRQAGIGVKFLEDVVTTIAEIENYLAGPLTSDWTSHSF